MAPVIRAQVYHVYKRSLSPGLQFTIVFALIATVIVVTAIVVVHSIPGGRERIEQRPLRRFQLQSPQSVRRRRPPQVSRATGRFFRHHFDLILKKLRSGTARELPRYNPRTQTPFPNQPALGESVSLSSLSSVRPTPRSDHTATGEGLVFSPTRGFPIGRIPSNLCLLDCL